MSNKVEKGQKYRGESSGDVYEILSDPFESDGETYVAYRREGRGINIYKTYILEEGNYTLLREPKFKVGDRIKWGWDNHGTIIAVSEDTDPDGDFGHLVKGDDGWFSLVHRPEAAE